MMTDEDIETLKTRLAAAEAELVEHTERFQSQNQRLEESWKTLGYTQERLLEERVRAGLLRAAMEDAEWVLDANYQPGCVHQCVWCQWAESKGHAPDCTRQLALGKPS